MPENDKDKGFIVISRNILDWEWFQDANTSQGQLERQGLAKEKNKARPACNITCKTIS